MDKLQRACFDSLIGKLPIESNTRTFNIETRTETRTEVRRTRESMPAPFTTPTSPPSSPPTTPHPEHAMTVRELIARLSRCANPDALVVLQKDGEGNAYSPLRGDASYDPAYVEQYVAETTWAGEVYPAEEDVGGVPCVVLAPIN